ncbi:MAG: hypothetical protein ACLQUY_06545 [Ktedonobacterales bacterium]
MDRRSATVRTLRDTIRWQARVIVPMLLVLVATASCGAGPSSNRTTRIYCALPSHPSAQGGCITQDPATGISLRVSNAYADATSTVVKLEIANTAGFPLSIEDPKLALLPGGALQSGGGEITDVTGGGSTSSTALLVYVPVPAADFGQMVQFVASCGFSGVLSSGRLPPTSPPAPPWLGQIGHLILSVPFELSPVRSGDYSYHQAPVIKQGIGVRVLSLQYSSTHTVFYGTAGGASIELIFSGLPADLDLLSFVRLESNEGFGLGEEGDYGPGLLVLHIPGMTISTPAFTVLQPPQWQRYLQLINPTVGSSGTVELEVSYQGTGKPTGEPATLSISKIQFLTGGIDGNSGNVPVLPSYQITLPMT